MRMYVGIDAGSRATKLVAVDADGTVVRHAVVDQTVQPAVTAKELFDATCDVSEVGCCIATGHARNMLAFADRAVTEITCHARGCASLYPGAGAIIEIGGQDSKFIRLRQGRVHDFVMNDRCAAGTGRFLEVMAVRLGMSLATLRDVPGTPPPVTVSSMCVVFAETEVIGLLATGAPPTAIMRGVQRAVATRVVAMMGERGRLQGDLIFTGGVAQVYGMKEELESVLGCPLRIPEMPQFTGALGAALIALAEGGKGQRHNERETSCSH
ncbi:MAG: acyl-CoA dehydratase activase [Kiritimatiellaeota bacterium]|nr:acyl-CoA dehydratase activase [Kiritimatiellota bacterium]